MPRAYAEINQILQLFPFLASTHFIKSHDTKTVMYAFGQCPSPPPFNCARILQIPPNQSSPLWTKDVSWTHIKRSEDIQDIFWTSSVYLSYGLCLV